MSQRKGQKRCKQCKGWYKPFNTLQQTCSVKCAAGFAQSKEGAEHAAKRKRQANKADKNKVLYEGNLSWWMKVGPDSPRCGGNTAYWCHKYIRLRDENQPCIMCESMTPKGGKWDACHYRTRGAAGHLRFHPDNIHKGCAHCNTYTNGDTAANYRKHLIERIGEDRVSALETDNDPHKWTIDELREIRDFYKSECKRLESRNDLMESA